MDPVLARRRATCAALALSAALLTSLHPVGAQQASPVASPAAIPTDCTVVASGLYNPRAITVGADGTLYIAESGGGGQTPDYGTPQAGTPVSATPVTTHGDTGRVTAIAPDGTQTVVADGLTSYVFGTEVVGPAGIAVTDDTIYVAVGGPGPGTAAFPPADQGNTVVAVDRATGKVTTIANLGEYERTNNPDPNAVDSDVSGLAIGVDGLIYVADAGGNDIFTIDPATNELSLLAVLPGIAIPSGEANPARGGRPEADPVPTGLVAAPDGGVYVGLLTGAALWAAPGSAKILHVAADGTVTDAATGLDLVVGVAMAPDGTLYATEFSKSFFATPPAPGTVARVDSGGSVQVVIPGLNLPYGIAVGPDGSVYVSINADTAPGGAADGQVLKCDVGQGASATPAA